MSELKEELTEAQNEAAATKEELNGCREKLEKLQELLQVQTLSQLKINFKVFFVLLHTHHSLIFL